jgi:arylsulfatase A
MKPFDKVKFVIIPIMLFAFISCESDNTNEVPARPNIVYILADDLGYGDVSIYNPQSRIKTPNIDQLASEGMRFMDAHSPSSVCTPTRYGILTGRYCWRSRLPVGVLRGYGEALLEKDRNTVASFLKGNGYTTGVIGKWHLGLDWLLKEEYKDSVNKLTAQINDFGMITEMNGDWVDFSKKPSDGPLNHGFDYSYILPASLDMAPYTYLENDSLVSIPDGHTTGNDLDTGFYGAFWRAGRISSDFKFEKVLPNFISKAEVFLGEQAKSKKPFFLYLPLASPHTPWVPTAEFLNKSEAGKYGDFVQMVDAAVGSIMSKLKELGLQENTIVVFTSDNGPYWREDKINKFDHRAAAKFRGMKGDIYEGGHRIPFIVRWPGKVEPGSHSSFTTTLTNLIATCSDIVGVELNDVAGEDSQSILPQLLKDEKERVDAIPIVHHSSLGFYSIRKGPWKLIEKRGSGGFSEPQYIRPEEGKPIGQLYNLRDDPSETLNLYNDEPKIVEDLLNELNTLRNSQNSITN